MAQMTELGPRIGIGRTAEVFGLGDDHVVKLFRPDFPETSINVECEVAERISNTGLPGPDFFGRCDVDGRLGIVYERLAGDTLLARGARRPHELFRLNRLFTDLHLRLHQQENSGLRPYRDSLERQIRVAPGLLRTEQQRLISYLQQLPIGRQVVCHGDFHPDNIILSPTGPVVIDWMTACSGEAAADVARTLLLLEIGVPTEVDFLVGSVIAVMRRIFRHRYQSRYFKISDITLHQVETWRPIIAAARLSEGIESEAGPLQSILQVALPKVDR